MISADSKFMRNDGLLSALVTAATAGVARAAATVQGEAIAAVPVDTGALQESITAHEPEQDRDLAGTGYAITATVSAGGGEVDYAAYVEFGTGIRGAASAGAGDGPYDPTWPGMAAQPYLRPALTTAREESIAVIADELSEVLA